MRNAAWFPILAAVVFSFPALGQDAPAGPWTGSSELSFVMVSGNTDSRSLGFGGELLYQEDPWGAEFKASYVSLEADGELSAEALTALVGVSRLITERLSTYGRTSYLQNEFAGINSRILVEGGAGYLVLQGPVNHFRLEGGVGYTIEDQFDEELEFLTGKGGAAYRRVISETAELTDDFNLFLNLEEMDDWRMGNVLALTSKMTDLLSLKVSHALSFYNEPVEGFEDTDQIVSAAIVAKW